MFKKKEKKNKYSNQKKGFFGEFKEFITRGNVLELAVGVIIGAAFSTVVNALTNKIIMPLINLIVNTVTGGQGIKFVTVLNGQPQIIDGAENPLCIYIDWGTLIEAIINFLLIALVLFLIVKTANTIATKKKEHDEKVKEAYFQEHPEERPAPEVVKPTELDVLNEIRDLLKDEKKKK